MNKNKIKESKQSDSAEHNLSDNDKNIRLPIYYGQKQNVRVHLFTLGDPSQNSEFICLPSVTRARISEFICLPSVTRARISEAVILHRRNGGKL